MIEVGAGGVRKTGIEKGTQLFFALFFAREKELRPLFTFHSF
jgi:hypothetical protein